MPRNNRGLVSLAWRFFDKVQQDGHTLAVVCKLCEKQYKFFGNTSNLRSHLIRSHPIQWELSNNGTLDEETLQKSAFESKTDLEQSETENEHNEVDEDGVATIHLMQDMAGQPSDQEEWLETENLSSLKKKAKRRKIRVKNIKREIVTPPRNVFTFADTSLNERVQVSPRKDEYSVFGEYIANKLRKFTKPRTRGNIQQLITTILWQAEYGLYDNADSVKRILMHSVHVEPEQPTEHVINVTIDPNQLPQNQEVAETIINEQEQMQESIDYE